MSRKRDYDNFEIKQELKVEISSSDILEDWFCHNFTDFYFEHSFRTQNNTR